MPRATRRAKPRSDTKKQLRKACLRLWDEATTPAELAERLETRLSWIYLSLDRPKKAVLDAYEPGVTAEEISEAKRIPIAYVKYVFRGINARAEGSRAGS